VAPLARLRLALVMLLFEVMGGAAQSWLQARPTPRWPRPRKRLSRNAFWRASKAAVIFSI